MFTNNTHEVLCKETFFENEPIFVNEELDQDLMKVQFFTVKSENLEYCCQNSSHILEVFGHVNASIGILNEDCSFVDVFEESSSIIGIKKYFQLCQIGDFILKRSFRTGIKAHVFTEICNTKNLNCDLFL